MYKSFLAPVTVAVVLCCSAKDAQQGTRQDATASARADIQAAVIGGGVQPCQVQAATLADSLQDTRERAAHALYSCDRTAIAGNAAVGEALRRSIAMGNSAAATILLLGYFPDSATARTLLAITDESQRVKLQSWMTPVPATLAAAVALTRLNRAEGRARVLSTIAAKSLEEEVFLLSVLPDIDDKAVLQALGGLLSDTREIRYGVPSGATPQRRLCDLAVDAFVSRFALKPDFPLAPNGRYGDAQIAAVRVAVNAR